MKNKKTSEYIANALQNVAVIGFALVMYDGRIDAAILAALSMLTGVYLIRRTAS